MHSKAALNAIVKVQQQRVLYLSGAKANNCEVGCLIDQTSGAASYTTAYKLDQVRLQDKMINQLRQNRDKQFIFIHNHPNNSNFSLGDIEAFLYYENIRDMCVVTNNGCWQFMIYKDSDKALLREWIFQKYIEWMNACHIDTVHMDAAWVIKFLSGRLKVKEFNNY